MRSGDVPAPLRAPLAVSMGDPAGLGADLLLRLWVERRAELPDFVLVGDPDWIAGRARHLGLEVPVETLADFAMAGSVLNRALPVLPVALAEPATPGMPEAANAAAVIQAIETAVAASLSGAAAAVVTLPIAKAVLLEAGFAHPGHTEFLGALAEDHLAKQGKAADPAIMMLACPQLRVVPVTVHQPLAEAVRSLSTQAIVTAGRVAADALRRDFAIQQPRLAVAGLNPHAGEEGRLGHEEQEIIAPAIAALQQMGLAVTGPLPADTMFHAEARENYDLALCMYHDQALVPLKTLDFFGGVNVTLGLPFIRTSPDHGTAFGLAGTGKGDARSLEAALHMAAEAARCRARTASVSGEAQ
ncbi:MAG: 4-hydroxythreonine-4-phosphate dehydrogenase PdxA [Rhodospirillaceae bacterium]